MTKSPCFNPRFVFALAFIACIPPALHAMGSPPLITDDPRTPGAGQWEINMGFGTERRPGLRLSEMPVLDLNYGIGDTVQLKYEVPYLIQSESGQSRISGLGDSEVGIKWRFHDGGEGDLAMSVYPQVEFTNPGSPSDVRDLVDHGSSFKLPIQMEKAFDAITVGFQLGREFRSAGDFWFYGLVLSRQVYKKVEVGLELAAEASAYFNPSQLTVNLGLGYEFSERSSFLVSIGRELHNHDEPKATFLGYVGLQWRLGARHGAHQHPSH